MLETTVPSPELSTASAVGKGQLGRGWPGHPPQEPPPQRGSGAACGTQNICFTGFLLFFLNQTSININIADVNKHDPQIHVQLYVRGEGGREGRREGKHFN